MPISISVDLVYPPGGPDRIRRRVLGAVDAVGPAIASEMQTLVQAPGSLWPVDTGLSKAVMQGYYEQNTRTAWLLNWTAYARYVEQRTRAARETIRSGMSRLVRAGREAAAEAWDRGL